MSRGKFWSCNTSRVNPTSLSSRVLTRIGRMCIWWWSYVWVASFSIASLQRVVTPRVKLLPYSDKLWMWFMHVTLWGSCIETLSQKISCLLIGILRHRWKPPILDCPSSLKKVMRQSFLFHLRAFPLINSFIYIYHIVLCRIQALTFSFFLY